VRRNLLLRKGTDRLVSGVEIDPADAPVWTPDLTASRSVIGNPNRAMVDDIAAQRKAPHSPVLKVWSEPVHETPVATVRISV